MNLYKKLNLNPVKYEPDVWVSRLVILKRITPNLEIIRDIQLTRGLNIIWAEETDNYGNPAEITGHSAGKTTFCRLLRYIFGERTFGTKTAMELIRKALPDGYVAAEIHVCNRKWAVRRPFGSGRMSYIKENASIEELLEHKGNTVTQDSYHKEIGLEDLLNGLGTSDIVQTGEAIQWAHILSWCTRDQEARFQNIHEWRSPRSEAEAPSFRFPKAGPLFVIRTVLGLFLPDELKNEERLAKLQQEKDRLAEEIENKRREPQYRVNLYDSRLRELLRSFLTNESDIDSRPLRSGALFPEDLERLTERVKNEIEKEIEETEQERIIHQELIENSGSDVRGLNKEFDQWEVSIAISNAADHELEVGLSKQVEKSRKIEQLKDKPCPFGGVLVQECSYFINRQKILKITDLKDAQLMKQAEERRNEELGRIEVIKKRIQSDIDIISKQREQAIIKRDFLQSHVINQREKLRDLINTYKDLLSWIEKHDRPAENEELNMLRKKHEAVEKKIVTIENELAKLLQQHKANRELLGSIFSGIVRSVLPSDNYDGEIGLEKRELSFRITHGPAMTGEAVETLSVLLADLCSLVYSTVSEAAHFPGFLLHDSPREADLSIGIYRSFIRFIAGLQDHFGSSDSCPFQYIMTTTTPPPDELNSDQFIKLRLNASRTEELLFRSNIATSRQSKAF